MFTFVVFLVPDLIEDRQNVGIGKDHCRDSYDITEEIITGLNKAYKPAEVKKEQKDTKK